MACIGRRLACLRRQLLHIGYRFTRLRRHLLRTCLRLRFRGSRRFRPAFFFHICRAALQRFHRRLRLLGGIHRFLLRCRRFRLLCGIRSFLLRCRRFRLLGGIRSFLLRCRRLRLLRGFRRFRLRHRRSRLRILLVRRHRLSAGRAEFSAFADFCVTFRTLHSQILLWPSFKLIRPGYLSKLPDQLIRCQAACDLM